MFYMQYKSIESKSHPQPEKPWTCAKKISPDLVLLDLNMTHIDDFQVMEQIRETEKGSCAPILVLTTQSDQNIQFNALAAEACDFVEKLFDITGVVFRISNMLEIRLLDN